MINHPASLPVHRYNPRAGWYFVRNRQAHGQYGFSLDELAAGTGLGRIAAAAQLRRLAPEVRQVAPRQPFYVVVPPEHAPRGAPPVEWWLDAYMAFRARPYYVGLLSAAAYHHSSHQAVQETQVLTDRPLRAVTLGSTRIRFFTKKGCATTPTFQPRGARAALRVSTAEATALDLLRYSYRVGGIARCTEVLAEMMPAFAIESLRQALSSEVETSVAQRLGWILEQLGAKKLAGEVDKHLGTQPRQTVVLAIGQPATRANAHQGVPDPRWRVIQNTRLDTGS